MSKLLLLSFLIFAVGGGVGFLFAKYPLINDITTTVDPLPVFKQGQEYPAEFFAIQRRHYPEITTLRLNLPAKEVFARALSLATTSEDWSLVRSDPDMGIIEAIVRTGLMGFKDDVVIRVRSVGEGSLVDMRSRSRVGRGDFGANASRIRTFLEKLSQ